MRQSGRSSASICDASRDESALFIVDSEGVAESKTKRILTRSLC